MTFDVVSTPDLVSVLVFGQSRIEIWQESEDEVTIDVTRYAGGDNWVKNTRVHEVPEGRLGRRHAHAAC